MVLVYCTCYVGASVFCGLGANVLCHVCVCVCVYICVRWQHVDCVVVLRMC